MSEYQYPPLKTLQEHLSAAARGEHAFRPATRVTPPPVTIPDDEGERCVIVIGTVKSGVDTIVGTFPTFSAAHEYAESGEHRAHDLSEVEWFIAPLMLPQGSTINDPEDLPEEDA